MIKLDSEENGYWAMMSFYESALVPVICQVVSCIHKKKIDKSFHELAFDLMESMHKQQRKRGGKCFPAIFKNPKQYFKPRPEIKLMLKNLKSQNKKLFLQSNFKHDFLNLAMKTTLGPDW